jgi:hypothetical protein
MQHGNQRLAAVERQMAAAAFSRPVVVAEPSLAELFNDPMTHAVMAADRVQSAELEALLRKMRAQLAIVAP